MGRWGGPAVKWPDSLGAKLRLEKDDWHFRLTMSQSSFYNRLFSITLSTAVVKSLIFSTCHSYRN